MNSELTNKESGPDNAAEPPRLVFLLGPPRSGTTWLQKLLGCHPEIGTAQESHLFNHFLGSMIESWDHLLNFQDGRGGIGIPAYQTEEEFLATLREQVHEVLSGAEEYRKGPIFLEKTPDHIRHIKDIQRVLPDARIILMLRRPADVIESMLNAGTGWGAEWAPGNTVQAIRLFRYFTRKAESDLPQTDPNSICVVEYEALRKNPADVLKGVLSFIGADHQEATIEAMLGGTLTLKKSGEFARRSGTEVEEPEGFARARKGRLSWPQRIMIRGMLGRSALNPNLLPNANSTGLSRHD